MKRILIGLIALAVLAAGGWFGFNLYARHRATAEIEAVFDRIRSQGGKASHGKVAFDLTSRTLTIEDIAVDPAGQPQAHVKIAGIKGMGLRQTDETRFAADSIEISGFEVALDEVGPGKLKASYKIPQMIMRDYAGPVHVQNAPASGALIDLYRFVLDQYASVTASSVTAPTLTIAFDAGKGAAGSGEVVYSGLAIQKLGKGKVDAMKADRASFTINVEQAGKADKLTGEMSDLIINDFDSTAIAAALDPQKANDDLPSRLRTNVERPLRGDVDARRADAGRRHRDRRYRGPAVKIPAGRDSGTAADGPLRPADPGAIARDDGEARRPL